ncbi:MAG: stage II sporulation protein M [Candidatus Woesearchaeota archaeon]
MLEEIFKIDAIKRGKGNLFVLAFIFSELGIISSFIIFPQNVGLMSISFTSILLMPYLYQILNRPEPVEKGRSFFGQAFKNHKGTITAFFWLFMGILLSYATFALVLPHLSVVRLFDSQLAFIGVGGKATATTFSFASILANNVKVLFAALILSLVYGAGAMIFLTWNASVWGAIFGYFAKQSAMIVGQNPIIYFFGLFLKVFPHTITEAGSYFFAVIAGAVISKAIIREEFGSDTFNYILKEGSFFFTISIVLIFIAAYLEVFVFPLF